MKARLRGWLTVATVGLLMISGCRHAHRRCCCECPCPAEEQTAPALTEEKIPTKPEPKPESLPKIEGASKPKATQESSVDAPQPMPQPPELTPTSAVQALPVRAKMRRLTNRARASFGHAGDYSWLTGTLSQLKGTDLWRLRFAAPEEDDPYGGCVTLVEAGPMDHFQDGQVVRVEGELVAPDEVVECPAYRVFEIHPAPGSHMRQRKPVETHPRVEEEPAGPRL